MMSRWEDYPGGPPPYREDADDVDLSWPGTGGGHSAVRRPTQQELEWLRHLSVGGTVAQLADRTGCSERVMLGRLSQLFEDMRVENGTEAMLLAQKRGWL